MVLAVHKPAPEILARQIDSIAAQRGVSITCTAVVDGAETAEMTEVIRLLESAGFGLITNAEPQGVRGAFAQGLAAALAAAPGDSLFSYADQDDIWHPDKLVLSAEALDASGVALAHCDARVIGGEGEVIAPSLHRFERRTEAPTLFGAMLLNAVTGMTSVFPRKTAALASRLLVSYDGPLLHDHVTAIAAQALGRTVLIDRALVDYRQHGANHLGAKPSRAVFRKRELGFEPFDNYRSTSMAIFRSRRVLARCLDAEAMLPKALRTLFLFDPAATAADVLSASVYECGKLFFRAQMRRWELSLRIADTALFFKNQALAPA